MDFLKYNVICYLVLNKIAKFYQKQGQKHKLCSSKTNIGYSGQGIYVSYQRKLELQLTLIVFENTRQSYI